MRNTAWSELSPEGLARLGGHMGVYELGTAEGATVLIGFAGGRSRFGLRGELERHLSEGIAGATQFRVEVTMGYWSRYKELLMLHLHGHGHLPLANTDDPQRLGRLSPG